MVSSDETWLQHRVLKLKLVHCADRASEYFAFHSLSKELRKWGGLSAYGIWETSNGVRWTRAHVISPCRRASNLQAPLLRSTGLGVHAYIHMGIERASKRKREREGEKKTGELDALKPATT